MKICNYYFLFCVLTIDINKCRVTKLRKLHTYLVNKAVVSI